jgi:hypothetical protein
MTKTLRTNILYLGSINILVQPQKLGVALCSEACVGAAAKGRVRVPQRVLCFACGPADVEIIPLQQLSYRVQLVPFSHCKRKNCTERRVAIKSSSVP